MVHYGSKLLSAFTNLSQIPGLANKVHVPLVPLNVLTAPRPFATWGIDMIWEIRPTTSNGQRFILVSIDYFTKWVDAASFAFVTKNIMA